MSTQRGNTVRTRTQRYKNHTAFKNDLHDKTNQQKKLNSLHVSETCQHCKDVIEWKIKYKKYKPLSQPKTCTRCQRRNITKAYHVLCRVCALDARVCAKCLKSAEEVQIGAVEPTAEDQIKVNVEMERLIKSLPERKRRAFIRYMKKGKKEENNMHIGGGPENQKYVPYSREELLHMIGLLKLNNGTVAEILELGSQNSDENSQDENN